jgi:hypothetical protein
MYISFFTIAIPVNYTSEFRELRDASTYIPTLHNYPVDKDLFNLKVTSPNLTSHTQQNHITGAHTVKCPLLNTW